LLRPSPTPIHPPRHPETRLDLPSQPTPRTSSSADPRHQRLGDLRVECGDIGLSRRNKILRNEVEVQPTVRGEPRKPLRWRHRCQLLEQSQTLGTPLGCLRLSSRMSLRPALRLVAPSLLDRLRRLVGLAPRTLLPSLFLVRTHAREGSTGGRERKLACEIECHTMHQQRWIEIHHDGAQPVGTTPLP